jgi:ribosomal protein S18 acetylase RimI-like enzyme
MRIRQATTADEPVLAELWHEFENEVPEPAHRAGSTWQDEWAEIAELFSAGHVLLAEDDEGPAGLALARLDGPRICLLDTIYVRPRARRRGLARALMAEVAAWGRRHGALYMTLEVLASNVEARAVYERLGFEEESRILVAPLEELDRRLTRPQRGRSFGSIHVQTDDVDAVVRAVRQFLPRMPGHSTGSAIAQPSSGWTSVYDELCDREPEMRRRLALELSDRMGAVVLAIGVDHGAVVRYVLLERGRVMDEYCSVPEYDGRLPPGEVIALGANPTVLARLTGADPAGVRQVARTAARPEELPPAEELLASIASVLGIEGATHGFESARSRSDVLLIERG